MKRLILILALLSSSAFGAITIVQSASNQSTNCNSGSGATCQITISTFTNHNAVVVFVYSNHATTTPTYSFAGGTCNATWTHAPNTTQGPQNNNWVDIYYCLDVAADTTPFTITLGGSGGQTWRGGAIYELSASAGFTYQDSNGSQAANPAASQPGTAFTLGSGNFITFQGIIVFTSSVSAIDSSYTFNALGATKAFAQHNNTNVGTAPNWTTNAGGGGYAENGIALLETGTNASKRLRGSVVNNP